MEHEFRCWDTEAKEMVYEDHSLEIYRVLKRMAYKSFYKTNIFMMYINKKDKNGMKIFDGDIVRWNNMNWPVFYSSRLGTFMMGDQKGCETLMIRTSHVEIVGNIYETPDIISEFKGRLKEQEDYLKKEKPLSFDEMIQREQIYD